MTKPAPFTPMASRRQFLQSGAGMATILAAGPTLPGFLLRTAAASTPGLDAPILVVIQLSGGNDGLNTVIPVHDDRYHRARPTLSIRSNAAHDLNGDLSLHPEMSALKSLYDDGRVGVITNVGYPNPDRSHFRSMDIWHTANTTPEGVDQGWLGRVADAHGEGDAPFALHLDDTALPLALSGARATVPSIRDVANFQLRSSDGAVPEMIAQSRRNASEDLLYVQRLAVSSCRQATRLEGLADDDDAAAYPNFRLANRLRQISGLIAADFGVRVYYTSIGGFDTHARQAASHGMLLRELSESVTAFQRDLERRGVADRVLTVTFSEFGRRVDENGSRGTDHGAAAPMFVVGSAARPGVHGAAPDLGDLDQGDVKHDVDFRSVYADVLSHWLRVDHTNVIGQFTPSGVLRT